MASHILHIPIDKFGRLVLPKELRRKLGVSEGTELEVEEYPDAILLRPVPKLAKVVYKEGLPTVELGEPLAAEQVQETIEKIRQERMNRL